MTIELKDIADQIKAIDTALNAKTDEFGKAVKAGATEVDGLKAEIKKLVDKQVEIELKLARPSMGNPARGRKSVGQQFIESKQYKDMLAAGKVGSSPFEVKDVVSTYLADPTNGIVTPPLYESEIVFAPQLDLVVNNLLPQIPIDTNAVYYQRGSYTRAATPKKESKQGTLVVKPQSTLTFALVAETVKTIPVYIKASRQAVEDAPQLQSEIQSLLDYDVRYAKDYQVLFGNGIDPNFNGICPQATPFDPTLAAALGVTNITNIDMIRTAMLQVERAGYPVDAIVLNPDDIAGIQLTKNTVGSYIWANPMGGNNTSPWGITVVKTRLMPAGYFLAGAFRMGGKVYNRSSFLKIADQNEDDLINNLVTILYEIRATLAVKRPDAFVYGGFGGSGS